MKTPIVKVDPVNPDGAKIKQAAEMLRKGGIIAFPTDTVYGIGADVFNENAVERIFTVKRRDPDKPLQVLIANKGDLKTIAKARSVVLDLLASEFWPGPLTLIILARDDFPKRARCGRNTVGVRMPGNPVALKLIETFGAPIAATSANMSGFIDPVSAEEVMEYLGGEIDLVIDGGSTPGNVPSTILDVSVYPPIILRQGKLSIADLFSVLDNEVKS